jgi:hypothetical protein
MRVVALFGLAGAVAATWDDPSSEGGAILAVASLGLGAGFVAWDILSAPQSARIHNRNLREKRLSLGVGSVGGAGVPGMVLTTTF